MENSTTTEHAQLKASDLTVGFEKDSIVSSLSFTLKQNEIIAVAGPNGAGKSTMVKAFARQIKPLTGNITLGETDIWALTAMQFAGSVAYVPQSLEPGLEITVEEMVMLGRNPHQKWWQWYGGEEDKRVVESALESTGMLAHKDKYLTQLSGGERQRACLATALAQQPVFMILDEPTAHLDFKHQLDLVAQLKDLRDKNIGCLVVLHDLNLIARIADKIVLLKTNENAASSIMAIGSPDEVLTQKNLADVFQVEVQIVTDEASGQRIYTPMRRIL